MALEDLRQTLRGNDVLGQFDHCVTVHLIVKSMLIVDPVRGIQDPGHPRTCEQFRVIRQPAAAGQCNANMLGVSNARGWRVDTE